MSDSSENQMSEKDEFEDFDFLDLDGQSDDIEKQAREDLKERCSVASIECEFSDLFGEGDLVTVRLPSGRQKREITLFLFDELQKLLEIPFEDYVFLESYKAICSYENGTIEALIRAPAPRNDFVSLYAKLLGLSSRVVSEANADTLVVDVPSSTTNPALTITLSYPSKELAVLSEMPEKEITEALSLKIAGIQISRNDDAVNALVQISNALFFQIDLLLGIPLLLQRKRQSVRQPSFRPSRRSRKPMVKELQFPRHEYDKDPISLYWYARNATAMPLLQFLAYYQVLEFYFPTYSQLESNRKIRNIMKEPIFRPDNETHINRILAVAQSSGGAGFGNERSQLKATIKECVDPDELRRFLSSDKSRSDFLSKKCPNVTDCKISIGNIAFDLREEVAERIYDIRCKIVHTKEQERSSDSALLLPYSPEEDKLSHDIDLVRYIARRVLVSSSTESGF